MMSQYTTTAMTMSFGKADEEVLTVKEFGETALAVSMTAIRTTFIMTGLNVQALGQTISTIANLPVAFQEPVPSAQAVAVGVLMMITHIQTRPEARQEVVKSGQEDQLRQNLCFKARLVLYDTMRPLRSSLSMQISLVI
jgi:hypothetical protein